MCSNLFHHFVIITIRVFDGNAIDHDVEAMNGHREETLIFWISTAHWRKNHSKGKSISLWGVWRRKGIGCDILGRRQLLLEFVCRWVLDLDFWIGCLEDIALMPILIFVALRESEREIGENKLREGCDCNVQSRLSSLFWFSALRFRLFSSECLASGSWLASKNTEVYTMCVLFDLQWCVVEDHGISEIFEVTRTSKMVSSPSLPFRSQKLNSIIFRKF